MNARNPRVQAPEGGLVKRVLAQVGTDELTDRAASLTYYAVLALFPMLLVLVSIVGLAGGPATDTLLRNVTSLAPGSAREIITTAIENLRSSQGAAGVVAVVGLAGALWSASGYVAAFMRSSNAIYGVGEGRPIWKTAPVRLGVTLALVVMLVMAAIIVSVSGSVAETVGDLLGLGSTAVLVWSIAKWPVLLVLVSLMFSLLYWASPNVRQPAFRWVSPGGLVAVVTWLAASAGFAFYVANFGSYNATYGAIAGVVVFLVWLWISNLALLFGAELNSELQRGRQIEKGMDPTREPFLPPRDDRKLDPRPETDDLPSPDAEDDRAGAPHAGGEPPARDVVGAEGAADDERRGTHGDAGRDPGGRPSAAERTATGASAATEASTATATRDRAPTSSTTGGAGPRMRLSDTGPDPRTMTPSERAEGGAPTNGGAPAGDAAPRTIGRRRGGLVGAVRRRVGR